GEVILMQRESPPPKLRATAPEASYSGALEALIDKAMSKLPEDRFQSAAELAAALAATPEGKAALGDAEGPKPAGKPAEAQGLADKAAKAAKAAVAAVAAIAATPATADGKGKDRGKPAAPMLTVRQDAKTTIDTVSAVRRRLESAAAPVRQFRLAWIGALFVVVALLALLLGRGLRHRGDGTATAARPASAPGASASATGAPGAAGAAESPQLEQARQM